MSQHRWIYTCVFSLAAATACDTETSLSAEERDHLMTFLLTHEMPVPASPTNAWADEPAVAVLGQKFFFDPRFSGTLVIGDNGSNGGLGMPGDTHKISCRSCHDMKNGAADTRTRPPNTSLGARYTPRNSPTMYNMPWLTFNHLDGRKHTIWGGSTAPIEGALASNRLHVAHQVQRLYADEFLAAFGVPVPDMEDTTRFPENGRPGQPAWDNMAPEDKETVLSVLAFFGKAIEAYLRLVLDRNAPFDRYLLGDEKALSPSAIRGMRLFIGKAGCDECHNGPTFSDRKFYNIGVAQVGDYVMRLDPGRANGINQLLKDPLTGVGIFSDDPEALAYEFEGLEEIPQELIPGGCSEYDTCGAFKTPSLRSIQRTAPYMHTGSIATLWDVVTFYNEAAGTDRYAGRRDQRIVPLGLTDEEINDLVAFLRTLDGDPIPDELTVTPDLPPDPPTTGE